MNEPNKFDIIAQLANAGASLSCLIMIMGILVLGCVALIIIL